MLEPEKLPQPRGDGSSECSANVLESACLPGIALQGLRTMKQNRLAVTVYLEDTDAQGIVYHANYLKYCERARTELLHSNGYTLGLMQEQGIRFVVFEMNLRYHRSAHLHDALEVRTTGARSSEYRLTFTHEVFRGSEPDPLFIAKAAVVTIDPAGELCPAPDGLLE